MEGATTRTVVRFAQGGARAVSQRIASSPRGVEPWVSLLDAGVLRVAARLALRAVFRSTRARALLRGWFLRALRRPNVCCEAGSSQRLLLDALLGRDGSSEPLDWIAQYLRAQQPTRAILVCESLVRISALGMLRHDLLAHARRRAGLSAPVLVELQLGAYPHCDLRCAGCYGVSSRAARAPEPATIARLVDEAAACGALAIHVVGPGEPFHSLEQAHALVDIVAAHPHLLFTIATSGAGFDESVAARLARLGNVLLFVAVEGPDHAHEARRGPGTAVVAERAMARMRRHGLLYGFSCMVGRHNVREAVDSSWLGRMEQLGCALGVYSRYFPIEADQSERLALDDESLGRFVRGLRRARAARAMPLVDLDEVEALTGCRARAGASVYVDAMTGAVTPCIRTPFAPRDCHIDWRVRGSLAQLLEGRFFRRYRNTVEEVPHGCGPDLGAELRRLRALIATDEAPAWALEEYGRRARRPVGSCGGQSERSDARTDPPAHQPVRPTRACDPTLLHHEAP